MSLIDYRGTGWWGEGEVDPIEALRQRLAAAAASKEAQGASNVINLTQPVYTTPSVRRPSPTAAPKVETLTEGSAVGLMEWLEERPYIKWGGIALGVILLASSFRRRRR